MSDSFWSKPPFLRRLSIGGAVRQGLQFAALAALAAASVPAGAADTVASDQALQEVVVTGSRIARTDTETPSPVQVLSRQDIEKSGQSNLAEVIRSVSADNQGSIPTAFTAGFASGASAVSLRGLGVNSTLVLVNGRRMAPYPLADDGARSFIDLNTIPLEAVERVEVLKDGASALYGSDAIGGVVNIILRSQYQGAQIAADVGETTYNDGTTTRISGSFGRGDIDSDRYNFYATAEVSRQEAIAQRDRPSYLGTNDLTPWDFFDNREGSAAAGRGVFEPGVPNAQTRTPYGTVRPPGATSLGPRINLTPCPEVSTVTGVCLYDDVDFYQIQPRVDRANVFGRGSFKFSEAAVAYAEVGWFHSKVIAVGSPGFVDDTGVYNPADPGNLIVHIAVLPAGHPDNPTGVDRPLRLSTPLVIGGRNNDENSNVTRFVAGLKGAITSRWSYELDAGYVESKLHQSLTGYVLFNEFQAALDAGTFRINPALDSKATLNSFSPTLNFEPTSSLEFADASVTGELFDLPGGPVGMAAGAEWRKERTNTPPVPGTDTGNIVGLGYSVFSSDRDVYAGYLEVNARLLPSLELDAAGRYDHYSDYGHSTTPKVGVKWTPLRQLAIRGTYSEGFRAPGPTESGRSAALGFTDIAIISVGNPDVKPETARSYTIGMVIEPLPSSSLSVDYYRIDRKNEINQADQASIVGDLPTTGGVPNSKIPGLQPGSFLYFDQDGNLGTISGFYANADKTKTDGLDFDLRQKFDLGAAGRLTAGVVWTHIISFNKTLADGTEFKYVGTHGPYALSSAGGTPRDRGSFELTWEQNITALTARMNYVSGMKMIDHEGETLGDNGDGTFAATTGAYFVADPNGQFCGVYNPDGTVPRGDCHVPSFITFDLFGKIDVSSKLELTATVLNVLNRLAPFDQFTYGGLNYNPAFTQAGAVGRFMQIGARYHF